MNKLNNTLINQPVMALPLSSGHMIFDTDACNGHNGYDLLQKQPDNKTKRIEYWYRFLSDVENQYYRIQRKLLRIVWNVNLLPPYLEGYRFKMRTDHDALKLILGLADFTCRLARWRRRL